MSYPGRFAGFRGKITPRSLERLGSAGAGGTVDSAQGSAEESRALDEHDQSTPVGGHELASEVGERVRAVISAAEAAANALRHEADQTAAVRRRVAEEEARRIIEDAKADADAYKQDGTLVATFKRSVLVPRRPEVDPTAAAVPADVEPAHNPDG